VAAISGGFELHQVLYSLRWFVTKNREGENSKNAVVIKVVRGAKQSKDQPLAQVRAAVKEKNARFSALIESSVYQELVRFAQDEIHFCAAGKACAP
jgi:hypothetical protein